MNNKELAPASAGELRSNGIYVTKREELPNGWQETHKVGKLKIRGEREPRTINYSDYAKLLTFYSTQERLIKDRKHIAVTLRDGFVVNTADITSLELGEDEVFIPKMANVSEFMRKLPTGNLILSMDGEIIEVGIKRSTLQKMRGTFRIATCHYVEKDGTRQYYTALDQIPEAVEATASDDPDYLPSIVQRYHYGIPQL